MGESKDIFGSDVEVEYPQSGQEIKAANEPPEQLHASARKPDNATVTVEPQVNSHSNPNVDPEPSVFSDKRGYPDKLGQAFNKQDEYLQSALNLAQEFIRITLRFIQDFFTTSAKRAKSKAEWERRLGKEISDIHACLLRELPQLRSRLKTTEDENNKLNTELKNSRDNETSLARKIEEMSDDLLRTREHLKEKTIQCEQLEGIWHSLDEQLRNAMGQDSCIPSAIRRMSPSEGLRMGYFILSSANALQKRAKGEENRLRVQEVSEEGTRFLEAIKDLSSERRSEMINDFGKFLSTFSPQYVFVNEEGQPPNRERHEPVGKVPKVDDSSSLRVKRILSYRIVKKQDESTASKARVIFEAQ